MSRSLIALMFVTAALLPAPSQAVDHYVPPTRDTPALYPVGSTVRLRCDGSNETRRGSIYGSAHALQVSLVPGAPMPKPARLMRWGTRLLVVRTTSFQPTARSIIFRFLKPSL